MTKQTASNTVDLTANGDVELHQQMTTCLNELADLISEYVGPETDLNGDIIESEYLVPFLTSSILGKIAWCAMKSVEDTEKGIRGLAARGQRMARRFNGSEIDDLELQKNTHRLRSREHQLQAAHIFLASVRDVYEVQTGRQYGNTGQNGGQAQTAAALEAQALAQKYGADPKDEKRSGNDGRPMIYTDQADGQKYALNGDGHYEPIAS